MTKDLDNEGLKSIARQYDLFFVDLWGVVHNGIHLHIEAVKVLSKLLEFEKEFTIEKIREALSSAEGCEVIDERKDGGYITPLEAEGKNETFISRIRKDNTNNKAVNLWCVSDNLLRGAALNAVEIAEAYIKNK